MQSATLQREDARNAEPLHPDMTRQIAPLGVVAATFYDWKHANDAIVDIQEAGFGHNAVALAFSTEAARRSTSVTLQEHSWLWKFRQRHEQDLHQRGDELMSTSAGEVPLHQSAAEVAAIDPMEVNLSVVLEMFGADSEDRIAILNHDMSPKGALLLVKCDTRAREVEAILERNAGTIRTEAVTTPLEPGESDPGVDERQPS